MGDPIEFLRSRLDEEEAVAKAADDGGAPWKLVDYVDRVGDVAQDVVRILDGEGNTIAASGNYDGLGDDEIRHIARWDPARVLREVEAKRRIIDEHPCREDSIDGSRTCPTCIVDWQWPKFEPWPCLTLRLLALPYADHAEYRQEEWRP